MATFSSDTYTRLLHIPQVFARSKAFIKKYTTPFTSKNRANAPPPSSSSSFQGDLPGRVRTNHTVSGIVCVLVGIHTYAVRIANDESSDEKGID